MAKKFKRTESKGPKRGFDQTNTRRDNAPRLEEKIDLFNFSDNDGKYARFRFMGDVWSYAHHWIEIKSKRKGKVAVPKQCLSYNPETEQRDNTVRCPYCEMGEGGGRFQKYYYANAIVRELQDDEPKKKGILTKAEKKEHNGFFYKDINSKTWTPVQVVRIAPTVAGKLQDLKQLNTARVKKKGGIKRNEHFDIMDPKYGCDVMIKYDSEAPGTDKYQIQKGDRSPLTEEELNYRIYKVDGLIMPEDFNSAKLEAKKLAEMATGKGPKKDDGKKKRDSDEDSYEDDEDLAYEDDEDDDDHSKKKKLKGKKKLKKKLKSGKKFKKKKKYI